MTQRLWCVSAGLTTPKRTDSSLARLNLYLNFGLLGLASMAATRGRDVRMLHGEFKPPLEVAQSVLQRVQDDDIVFLSLPSCFAVTWAADFLRELERAGAKVHVAVGGRWVVGNDPDWIKRKLPPVGLVFMGTAEAALDDLCVPSRWPEIERRQKSDRVVPLDGVPSDLTYDYSLVSGFKKYQPSVEIARGCGFGCAFCVDAAAQLNRPKSPQQVAVEIEAYRGTYDSESLRPYFEASLFRPTIEWARNLAETLSTKQLAFQWRCESRADVWSRDALEQLRIAGLTVMDIGLDSGDPDQLLRMNKTRNPQHYLKRAEQLLEWCAELGIWAKVNVLLYAGETNASLARTRSWLLSRRSLVKGVSVNPLIAYRSDLRNEAYLASLRAAGASIDRQKSEDDGYCRVELSPQISAQAAERMGLELSQELMSARDYFDLKMFSYFPRDMSLERFSSMAAQSEAGTRPFRCAERTEDSRPEVVHD